MIYTVYTRTLVDLPADARKLFQVFRLVETEHFGRPLKVWAHLVGVCTNSKELLVLLHRATRDNHSGVSDNRRGVKAVEKEGWYAVYTF